MAPFLLGGCFEMFIPACVIGAACLPNVDGVVRAGAVVFVYALFFLLRWFGAVAAAEDIFEFLWCAECGVDACFGKGTFQLV